MRIECCAAELPKAPGHPNRLPFLGILAIVDEPSDKAPGGARCHNVIMTRQCAVEGLPSLIGMSVNTSADYSGHDAKRKLGVITKAYMLGNRIIVKGFLYALDWKREIRAMRKKKLGMSYELNEARIEDMRENNWKITKAHFVGAAVQMVEKSAYLKSRFWIANGKLATVNQEINAENN
jgi:hypothetical protein